MITLVTWKHTIIFILINNDLFVISYGYKNNGYRRCTCYMSIGFDDDNYQEDFKDDDFIRQIEFNVDRSFQEFSVTIVKRGLDINCSECPKDGN